MLVFLEASRRVGEGMAPGPRIRPRRDEFWLPERALAVDGIPVLTVEAAGPPVWVTTDRRDTGPSGDAEIFIGASYVDAVIRSGGRPLLVPPGTPPGSWIDGAQALVITGGHFDIHPRHYGATITGRIDRVEASRTAIELALARHALTTGLPVLGICGGMQVLAVAAGGSLIQDLPLDPPHEQQGDPALPSHDVAVTGRLSELLGPTVRVNSTHHQSVDSPGRAFDVAAVSPDGVVEAIHSREHPFAIGLQWHPELLGDDRLYRALMAARRPPSPRGADPR